MSFSLNEWCVMGMAGNAPDVRKAKKTGASLCRFQVAVAEWHTGAKTTLWVPVSLHGDVADRAAKCVFKGTTVWLRGRFEVSEWTDSRGNRRVSFGMVAYDFRAISIRAQQEPAGEPPAIEDEEKTE